jgi:ABC-2 type transport system permease protein
VTSEAGAARIHEAGFQRYDGPRRGVNSAMYTLAIHAVQRVLGIKRSIWNKILPAAAIALAFIPAFVFVGLAAFLPESLIEEGILPDYWEYYGFSFTAVVIFTAFVAPEVLCTDRRSGMLSLYLASPLTRDTYLLAKGLAVMAVVLVVTIGPSLFLLLAYTVEGAGPDNVGDFLVLLLRIVVAGIGVALVPVTLSLAVSSFTTRRAMASAGIVMVIIISIIAVSALIEEAGWSDNFGALAVGIIPFELAGDIFGEPPSVTNESDDDIIMSTWVVMVSNVGWAALFSGITWWRYRNLEVER